MLACSELDALERRGSVIKEQAKAVKCAIIVDDPEPFPKTGFYEVCVFYTAHGNCEGPFAGICLPSSGDEAAVSFGVHVEHGSPHNLQLVRPKVLNHMSLVVRRDPVLAEPLAFQVLDAHGNVCSSMTARAICFSIRHVVNEKIDNAAACDRGTSNKHTRRAPCLFPMELWRWKRWCEMNRHLRSGGIEGKTMPLALAGLWDAMSFA